VKRALVTILAFLYLSSSMGATIHLHYCMGKMISWSLIDHESDWCTTCGMHKTSGGNDGISSTKNCCKDEHKQIITNNDQKLTSAEFQFSRLSLEAVPVPYLSFQSISFSSITTENPAAHGPPVLGDKPLFLLNRNFRI
jgi:hypothetical protein